MATLPDYSADNPFVQAERTIFDPAGKQVSQVSRGGYDPEASPSVGNVVPSAVPGVTAKLNSLELLEGSYAGGGIDGLEVAVIGRLDRGESGGEDVYLETAARLEAARVSVTEGQRDAFVEVMGATLAVGARGAMWGDTWFQWFCEYDGIQVALVRPESKGSFVAKVQIRSLKLSRDGVELSWRQAKRLLETLGVIVESTSVYQVDACVDLPGVKVDPFCESLVNRECVTRMKARSQGRRRANGAWQGACIGNRQGLYVRFYNKSHELDERSGMESDAKRAALVEGRWGRDCEDVTRVELAMRGSWMRKHYENCTTVEQVIENLPAIIDKVVTEFFRIVDGPVDRDNNNQQRAKLSSLWVDVCEVFRAVFGPGFDLQRKKVSAFKVNVEHAGRRLISAAKAYCAACGPDVVKSQATALRAIINKVSSGWDQSRVMADLRDVWASWQARVTADLAFESTEPGSRAGAGPLQFPDRSQIPWDRYEILDKFDPTDDWVIDAAF
jgi:hypothetical protein